MSQSAREDGTLDVPGMVRAIVAETLKRPVEQVPFDAKLESGLGVDSMAMIDIGVSIEERFDIAMPADLAREVRVETVADLVRVVEAQLGSAERRN